IVLFHSAFFAYLIRLNFEWASLDHYHVVLGSTVFLGCGLLVMFFTKSYVGIVRHTRMKDGVSLFRTIVFTLWLMGMVNWLAIEVLGVHRLMRNSVSIITSLLALFNLVLYRLLVKDYFSSLEKKKEKKDTKKVIICRAGEAGILTHDVVKKHRKSNFVNCGFLDDDPKKQGKLIDGVKIYGGLEALEQLVDENAVTDLIISVQDISEQRKREII